MRKIYDEFTHLEIHKNLRARMRRVRDHLCINCGNALPPDWVIIRCPKCRKKHLEQVDASNARIRARKLAARAAQEVI